LLTERLTVFWVVNAVQANAFAHAVAQHGDGVAVRDARHLPDKGSSEGGAAPNANNTEASQQQESAMSGGLSLHEMNDQWHEAKVTEASVSDTNLTVEVDAPEGDTVTVTATSTDGVQYQGDYRYREGSNSNGEVVFERHKGQSSEVMVGDWREAGGFTGRWIIKIG